MSIFFINIEKFCRNYYFLLGLIWTISAVLVNPIGEFPLNDDWAYSLNVYHLSELGEFKLNNWPAMTLIAQTLFGVLLSQLFGFSFTTLRISVLILGGVGITGFFHFLKKIGLNDKLSFLIVLLFAFNPLYFSLSYTFMTDIPFLVLSGFSLWYFYRFCENFAFRFFNFSFLFFFTAVMIRQSGLALPLAGFITILIYHYKSLKTIAITLFALIFSFASYYFYREYSISIGYQSVYNSKLSSLVEYLLRDDFLSLSIFRFYLILQHIGLFLLPLSILTFPFYWRNLSPAHRKISLIISIILSFFFIFYFTTFPCYNIINHTGIGPRALKDTAFGENLRSILTSGILLILRSLGVIGAFLLIFSLAASLLFFSRSNDNKALERFRIFALINLFIFTVFLISGQFLFDRYLLVLLPFLILLIIQPGIEVRKVFYISAFVLLIPCVWFSIAGTHDYLEWNRSRWTTLRSLHKQGINANKIDGGMEYNLWYYADDHKNDGSESWWGVGSDEYIISAGPYRTYSLISETSFNSWLHFDKESIFVGKEIIHDCDTSLITNGAEFIAANNRLFLTSHRWTFSKGTPARSEECSHSGLYSIKLSAEKKYGFTTNLEQIAAGEKIRITAWCKGDCPNLVLVAENGKKDGFYISGNSVYLTQDEWKLIGNEFSIPVINPPYSIFIYFDYSGSSSVFIDDLTIRRIYCHE